jgi:SAM-dependent methyltransferase
MRIAHFDALRPICPRCRRLGTTAQLAILLIEAEAEEDIESGILSCQACGAEYPILDGLPIIVPDVRRYIQDNLFYLLARTDLPAAVESLIGDAAGPGSGLDSIRQHVSSYVWDHWADRDPAGPGPVPDGIAPGAIVRTLTEGLGMADGAIPDGPILDIGCAAGRTVAELAERTGRMVLGIDISIPLARCGRRAVAANRVDYGLRRTGLVYERRGYPAGVGSDSRRRADIWICDTLALPFRNGTFGLATALNVVDCMTDPRTGLVEVARVLGRDAPAVLSVPFDWSGQVTPPEAWLGGHSQRAAHGGDPVAILDMLLSDGSLAAGGLRRVTPAQDVPWHVRLHDRSCMKYSAHLVVARKTME